MWICCPLLHTGLQLVTYITHPKTFGVPADLKIQQLLDKKKKKKKKKKSKFSHKVIKYNFLSLLSHSWLVVGRVAQSVLAGSFKCKSLKVKGSIRKQVAENSALISHIHNLNNMNLKKKKTVSRYTIHRRLTRIGC